MNGADPSRPAASRADNGEIAQTLREMAVLLEAQGDNPFRVAAYRRAADTEARLPRPVREIHDTAGLAGLDDLPGIGPRIAAAIAELLDSGRWAQLERLRGAADPETLLRTIPGVGPELAHHLHDELGVDTLEGLEVVAQAGRLPLIAPRRFNPDGKAWLPVLHAQRPGWHFTALYSNTARAHELDPMHDWVVLYADDDQHHERPYTVVTGGRGSLLGRRVVRGREDECMRWYAAQGTPAVTTQPVTA